MCGRSRDLSTTPADDGQHLPEELARRETLHRKVSEAQRKLEARAAARAGKEPAEYERKPRERENRPENRKGPEPKAPDPTPAAGEQVNGEWKLVCLAYNVKRLHTMIRA